MSACVAVKGWLQNLCTQIIHRVSGVFSTGTFADKQSTPAKCWVENTSRATLYRCKPHASSRCCQIQYAVHMPMMASRWVDLRESCGWKLSWVWLNYLKSNKGRLTSSCMADSFIIKYITGFGWVWKCMFQKCVIAVQMSIESWICIIILSPQPVYALFKF